VRIPLSPYHLAYYAFCGTVGISLPNYINLQALAYLPAGIASVLVNLAPLFTYTLSTAFKIESFRPLRFIGVLLGFAGILLIVIPDASLPGPNLVGWVFIAIATPLCYSVNNVFIAKFRPAETHAMALSTGQMLVAGGMLTPIVFSQDLFLPIWPPFDAVDAAMMGQIVISAVNFTLVYEVIRRAGPVFFSQVAYVVTLTGIAWAALIFGESLSVWVWGSVAAVFVGVYLVNHPSSRPSGRQ